MSYDVIRSVRQLIESGIGDVARLAYILDRLENGKYLYLSDQRYLENVINTNQDISHKHASTESHAIGNLESELRDINVRLEKILHNKTTNEKEIIDGEVTPQINSKSKSRIINVNIIGPKNENITLILSVIFGLIFLQGIGHIYIGKIAKGIGIFVLSVILYTISLSYYLGITKDTVPSFLQPYLLIITIVGYLGLYAFQILDSHKICVSYNAYVNEHKTKPPWW